MDVWMSFTPKIEREDDKERLVLLHLNDALPSTRWIEKHKLLQGVEALCAEKTLVKGKRCAKLDWLFPHHGRSETDKDDADSVHNDD